MRLSCKQLHTYPQAIIFRLFSGMASDGGQLIKGTGDLVRCVEQNGFVLFEIIF